VRSFVIVSIGLAGFAALVRVMCLAILDYPRNKDGISRVEDAAAIVLGAAWCAWGFYLLNN
jgi:hypothetical protein